jgi:hypothetical protein
MQLQPFSTEQLRTNGKFAMTIEFYTQNRLGQGCPAPSSISEMTYQPQTRDGSKRSASFLHTTGTPFSHGV